MDAAATRALTRLRAPEGTALRELALEAVKLANETPMREVAQPRWLASQLATALEAASTGDRLETWTIRRIEAERARWAGSDARARAEVPPEVDRAIRQVLGRTYAPDEALVVRLLDHAAMRTLVRDVLTTTLHRFRQKVNVTDAGLGGLGQRAMQRGRGLFGNLGGVAENIVGAVKDEVEYSLDQKVREFASQATSDVIRSVAKDLADPTRAGTFSEMRIAVFDALLDTPARTLVAEADKLGPGQLVGVVAAAIRALVKRPDFVDEAERRIGQVLAEAGDGTFGAWLDEVGLRSVWTDATVDLVAGRMQATVATDAFADWWERLHAK